MILDEPLTAMIPPPDLWGSTGYTANNNKVGAIVMVFYKYIFYISTSSKTGLWVLHFIVFFFRKDLLEEGYGVLCVVLKRSSKGRRGAGGRLEQGVFGEKSRGELAAGCPAVSLSLSVEK